MDGVKGVGSTPSSSLSSDSAVSAVFWFLPLALTFLLFATGVMGRAGAGGIAEASSTFAAVSAASGRGSVSEAFLSSTSSGSPDGARVVLFGDIAT